MSDLHAILADSANRLFTETLSRQSRAAAEEGNLPDGLWQAIEENGFCHVLVSEARGGAGAGWLDALVLLKACGVHAVPLPLPETILAAWFLDQAGLEVPNGPLTFAAADMTTSGGATVCRGPLNAVPFAAYCAHVVALAPAESGLHVALFAKEKSAEPLATIARDPVAHLTVTSAAIADAIAPLPADAAMLFGALMRSAGIAGALQAVLSQAVEYAGDRKQFGRPIAKFQAIQHQLAELATHTARVGVAVDAAGRAVADDAHAAAFDIAVAKVLAADAARTGASIAHQTHGAIGFTYEHGLHFWTRRLWSWAPDYGGATHWARMLGEQAIAAGGHGLWSKIVAR